MKKKAIVCMLLCTAMAFTCACGNSKDETKNKDDTTKATTDTVKDKKSKTTTDNSKTTKDTNDTTKPATNDDSTVDKDDNSGYTAVEDDDNTAETPKEVTEPAEDITEPQVETPLDTTEPQEDTETPVETPDTTEPQEDTTEPQQSAILDPEMSSKVTDYILNGQGDALGASSVKWNPDFLAQVDIQSLYEQFVAEGGNPDDINGVAWYITNNAPIASNWEEMFKEAFNNSYGQYPTKIESIDGLLYQAYANVEGKEVPYVTVNARTGYWHG